MPHIHAATAPPPIRERSGRRRTRPLAQLPARGRIRVPYGANRRLLRREPRFNAVNLVLGLIALVLVAWIGWGLWQFTRVDAALVGMQDGDSFTSERSADLALDFRIPEDRVESAGLELDGKSIREEARRSDLGLSWGPLTALDPGEHDIALVLDRPLLADAAFHWTFTVDDAAPTLPFPTVVDPVPIDEPVKVEGSLDRGERMWLDGDEVDVSGDGDFELEWERPPVGPPFDVRVVDAAGNETLGTLAIPVDYAETRGIHVRAEDWADEDVRAGVLALVDQDLVNAVELDLKDEAGFVGYESELDTVREIGADAGYYDIEEAVDTIHDHGAKVVGRLVAFNDPEYAQAAWNRNDRDEVVQTKDGEPLERGEGMFLNFADPDVRAYVISIAVEAADAGVDDILLDYVRRPDGAFDEMRFAGLTTTPEEGIVAFLRELQPELRERGAYLGASVFGIAARAPTDVAQDVELMSGYLDYMSPMLYPSHFREDNYNVESPIRDPYTIVARVLADFQEQVADRGIPLVPWLQDFSFAGVTYDEPMVRAQIDAACASGVNNHLLWNARSDYTIEALGACP
jgi:hypothetical protein